MIGTVEKITTRIGLVRRGLWKTMHSPGNRDETNRRTPNGSACATQRDLVMMVRGSVDVITGTEVRGWAFAAGRWAPVLVQAVLNHEILGERFAAPSIMARSVPASDGDFCRPTIRSSKQRLPPDTPNLQAVPDVPGRRGLA